MDAKAIKRIGLAYGNLVYLLYKDTGSRRALDNDGIMSWADRYPFRSLGEGVNVLRRNARNPNNPRLNWLIKKTMEFAMELVDPATAPADLELSTEEQGVWWLGYMSAPNFWFYAPEATPELTAGEAGEIEAMLNEDDAVGEADSEIKVSSIASARVRAGLTQRQLSKILGVTQPQIAKWEGGKANPMRETLNRIAEALKCRPDELL